MILDNKIEVATAVGATILLSGVSRLYVYYKCFNITILPFIELDEIVVATFDSILYFIIISTLFLLVLNIFYSEKEIGHNWKARLKSYNLFQPLKTIFLVLATVSIVMFNDYARPNPNDLEVSIWFILLILCIYIIPIIFLETTRFLQERGQWIGTFRLIAVFSGIFLLASSIALPVNEAHKVKKGFYDGVCVTMKQGLTLESTSTFIFIGMTKNYVFFYDKISSKVHIYKNEISRVVGKHL